MKTRLTLILLAATAITTATSEANAACLERITPTQRAGRNAWAEMWGYITPTEATLYNSQGRYVEFAEGCYELASGGTCSTVVPVTATGSFVPGLTIHGICAQYDCYTPSQRILVAGEYVGIEDAATSEAQTVTTLAVGSTMAEPLMSEQPVSSFPSAPISTEIYVLNGNGGERLEVTGGHPMVLADGTIVPAKSLQEGDILASAEGGAIRLVRIETHPYEGKVWNVEPKSEDKAENIVMAEGFLAGTVRFQNQWANESFRLFVRDHADVEKITSSH